jgi:hypothetical protein
MPPAGSDGLPVATCGAKLRKFGARIKNRFVAYGSLDVGKPRDLIDCTRCLFRPLLAGGAPQIGW